MDGLITLIAQYLIVVPICVTIILLASLDKKTRIEYAVLLLAGGVLALLLAKTGSYIYENPRPFLSDGVEPLFIPRDDNGFPSDHTLLAAFLAFAALVYNKRAGYLLLAVALLIGWSRVAANVHHGIDIAGGFAAAGLAVLLVHQIQKKIRQKPQEEKEGVRKKSQKKQKPVL